MSFIDEIRARRNRGPGSVDVIFTDTKETLEVPLRYPSAADQSKVVEFLSKNENVKDASVTEFSNNLCKILLQSCVKEGDKLEDDDINVLTRESGGTDGALIQRCMQLCGLGNNLGNDGEVMSRVTRKKKPKSQ